MMSEWWTYRLEDLILFSRETYYRQFELYNAEIWPAQIGALLVGFAILVLLFRQRSSSTQALFFLLAAVWGWVAWRFFHLHHSNINPMADVFAIIFAIQTGLLFLTGFSGSGVASEISRGWPWRMGFFFFLFALIYYQLVGVIVGRPILQSEFFGLTPDPTVMGTLAVFLTTAKARWWLYLIPLLWCAISGAILWVLAAPDFWILPTVGVLVIGTKVLAQRET